MKFTALITFLLPFSVQAVSFDDIRLWAGSGSNQAALGIDFNDGQTPRSYLWGYRWDGAATGEDALRAVVEADIALTATFDVFSFGASLNTVTYLGHSQSQNSNPGQYWSYWVTTNGHVGLVAEAALDSFTTQSSVVGAEPALPARLALSLAHPNPSRGAVTFTLDLPRAGPVTVRIMDVAGRDGWQESQPRAAGRHTLLWPGAAPAGLYLARVQAGGSTMTRRVVRVR